MWARIDINPENRSQTVVMEITGIDPAGRFHPSLVWVECPEGTQQGYIYENGSFTPPDEVS